MSCLILFHCAHNVVFFVRLVKRKNFNTFFDLSVRGNRILVRGNRHRSNWLSSETTGKQGKNPGADRGRKGWGLEQDRFFNKIIIFRVLAVCKSLL